jgi:hypothetical protein
MRRTTFWLHASKAQPDSAAVVEFRKSNLFLEDSSWLVVCGWKVSPRSARWSYCCVQHTCASLLTDTIQGQHVCG